MSNGKPYKNFVGYRVKTWTVVAESGFSGGEHMKWLARCECGREQTKASASLGRWRGYCECTGGSPDRIHELYGTWANMRHRCYTPSNKNYPAYGGRGIKVCERWLGRAGFDNFVSDVGPRPLGATLDRVNPNGNYEPSNVRWATAKEQANNQRLSHRRVAALLDMLEQIIDKHPATTSAVTLGVLRKQLLGATAT